jgi:hypothetical protein
MSDTQTLPAIAPAPAGASPETLAAADALYDRAGYSKEDRAAAGYAAAPVVPPVNNNMQVTQPAGGNVAIMSGSNLSHDQALSAAKNLIVHGVDPAIVLEAAKQHGVTEAELAYTPPSKETVAAAQRDAETAQGFAPPAKGERYDLQYERGFAEGSEPEELAALDRDVQTAFTAAQVPKELSQPLLTALLDTGRQYAYENMSDVAKQTLWQEERAMFTRASRNPQQDLDYAAKGLEALPKAFRDQLYENNAIHSARAFAQLAAFGRALEYRAARKGK